MMGAALITGAGKRIGKDIARSLGKAGLAVALHYGKSRKEAETVAKEIKANGGIAATVQADLTNYSETKNLVSKAANKLGQPLNVLINNAAFFKDNTLDTFSDQDWKIALDTNLKAPAILSQQFAKNLAANKEGAIINIIDQRVLKADPQYLTYTISKHALWSLTRLLAVELAPNIRVNGIAPGPTLANIYQSVQDFETEATSTLLGRGPTLNDITAAVKFLLETRSITGQMITLDGGQHLQ